MKLSSQKRRALLGVGTFFLALLLGLVLSFALERAERANRVGRGVSIGAVPLSGLDAVGLRQVLHHEARRLSQIPLLLRLDERDHKAVLGELGVSFDVERNVGRVLSAGRDGSLVFEFGFWLQRLFSAHVLLPELEVKSAQLETRLRPWAAAFLVAPRLPSISYHQTLRVEAGQAGTELDYQELTKQLLELGLAFWNEPSAKPQPSAQREPVTIAVHSQQQPLVVPVKLVEARKAQAERLLSAPILVRSVDKSQEFSLSPRMLGAALGSEVDPSKGSLELILSMSQLRPAMHDWLAQLERPAQEASFSFSPTQPAQVLPSVQGLVLDERAFVDALWAASAAESRELVLPLVSVEPKLSTEQAESLKIRGLVSQFLTRHACCQPRVDNIHTAAALLDGTVLRPGESLSMNALLGPRTKAAGYKSAPTIVHGEMEDVYGGGISQLATTLFNAALRGGYKIVQRQPHSIYFPRYPEGHEATVSFPEPDLIFENDTASGLLIKTEYTDTFIKVLFYGDNAGRLVSVDKSARYNIVQPPIEYEPNEHTDPEKPKRVRAGQMGWTVTVSRTIKQADGATRTEKREVVYKPRAELVRIHPCMIPEGEKGHTGEECPEPEEIEREESEEELSEEVYYETSPVPDDGEGD